MPLNKNQTKKLIKSVQKFRTGLDISVKDLYTIIDAYKRNIKCDTETIYKWTKYPYIIKEHEKRHTYQIEYPFKIKSEAYIHAQKNVFTFVSLWVASRHKFILSQANTKLTEKIFLYINKLYNSQHH